VAKSEAGATGDRVAAAADELYGADPAEFTERRKALADAARAADDPAAAKQIGALRKPTRAAWVVNRLARADPGAPGRLASLADDLRAAEQARDGRKLRELSASRGPLVDALTGQALDAAGVPDPPSGLREEVAATLTAAIADPEVAAEFAAGTLTRAAQWAGFGLASFAGTAATDAAGQGAVSGDRTGSRERAGGETATDEAPARQAPAGRRLRAVPSPEGSSQARSSAGDSARASTGSRRAVRGRLTEEEQARRTRAEQERLAEEAARRAAQRRKAFEDAERTVASTAAAAAEAVAAEDQLEAEVRDLEQRLIRSRAELASTRMRARRAEVAERRARQTLDRLPRPDD
jgi:hypothetical protein